MAVGQPYDILGVSISTHTGGSVKAAHLGREIPGQRMRPYVLEESCQRLPGGRGPRHFLN